MDRDGGNNRRGLNERGVGTIVAIDKTDLEH